MLKKILIGLAVVLAIFVVVVATRPGEFSVSRSAVMDAPPDLVYGIANDMHRFPEWSPWQKLDPSMKVDYSGPATGVGAGQHWVGNNKVGEGEMKITESVPGQKIAFDLEFMKPMKASNKVVYSFQAKGNGTEMTWAMTGKNGFVGKAFTLFMDMDKMVGPDFERGLANMKGVAEAAAKAAATPAPPAGAPAASAPPAAPPAPPAKK